jgi:hypothetical protein
LPCHQDEELAQLAKKIDRLEHRLLGEARSVGARSAAPASASLAYAAPTQRFGPPHPIEGNRAFGIVLGRDR